MPSALPHDADSTSRLIAKVLRELLRDEHFDSYADLVDALKTRLARLHIRYAPDDIATAIAWVESNTDALGTAHLKAPVPLAVDIPEPGVMHQDHATRLRNIQRLRGMVRRAFQGKSRKWPTARPLMTREHIEEFRQREGLIDHTRPAHVAPLPLPTVTSHGKDDDDGAEDLRASVDGRERASRGHQG